MISCVFTYDGRVMGIVIDNTH